MTNKGRTIFQFLGNFYESQSLRKIGASISIIVYVGSVGIEFYALMKILRFLGLPPEYIFPVCVALTVLTVMYVAESGFRGVVKTEKWQLMATILGWFAILALFILGIISSLENGSIEPSTVLSKEILSGSIYGLFKDPTFIVGSFMLFLFFMIGSMDAWQRCAAISNHEDPVGWVRGIMWGGTIVFPIIYFLPLLCGLFFNISSSASYAGNDTSPLMQPLILGLSICSLKWQILLFGFVFSCFVGAMVSTADTLLMSATYALFYDVLGVKGDVDIADLDFSNEKLRAYNALLLGKAKKYTIILGLFSIVVTIIGYLEIGVTEFVWALFSSVIVFAVPLLFAILFPNFAKNKGNSAILSISGGFIVLLPGKDQQHRNCTATTN